MQKTLESLYDDIAFYDKIAPKDSEYNEVNDEIAKELEQFEQTLTPKQYKRLEDLVGLVYKSNYFEQRETFCKAFKVGVKIIIETMTDKNI